jgi:hypothetical protein
MGVGGLGAVTIIGIFAGYAVGQRVHVGLADDDGALGLEPVGNCGILTGRTVAIGVEAGASGGD